MAAAIIAWTVLILVWTFRHFLGWPSSFTLLPFQSGILYRQGQPIREVGPGRHRVWVGIEKILFVDTRPIAVSFENRAVALTDGATAVYGFSGSAEIDDVRKALYSAGNHNEIPAFVLICCARSVLNNQDSAGLGNRQATIANEITERARTRLSQAGFRLLNFRLTQLNVGAPAPPEIASKY